MDSSYLTNPAIFVIDSVFTLYILALVLRMLLQWAHADFYNPISQFIVKVTHPPLKIMRRFIPSLGKIDTASLVLAFFLQMIADFLILLLIGKMTGLSALAIMSFAQLVTLLCNILLFAIFIRAILSWVDPGNYNPASSMLMSLTEPVLSVFRKIVPDLGGVDLSPLVAILMLQLAKMIIIPPLEYISNFIA